MEIFSACLDIWISFIKYLLASEKSLKEIKEWMSLVKSNVRNICLRKAFSSEQIMSELQSMEVIPSE